MLDAIAQSTAGRILLHGTAGIGTSSLAAAFAKRARADFVDGVVEEDSLIRMRRLPADLRRFASGEALDAHLAVDADHPLRSLRAQAGVLFRYGPADSPPTSPACVVAAVIEGDTAFLAPGSVRLTASDVPATAAVSAVYLWLSHGRSWADLPSELWVDLGHGPQPVQVIR